MLHKCHNCGKNVANHKIATIFYSQKRLSQKEKRGKKVQKPA